MPELHITDKTARQYTISLNDAEVTILGKVYKNTDTLQIIYAIESAFTNNATFTVTNDSYVQVWNCRNLVSVAVRE
jgi:hypothetical protein